MVGLVHGLSIEDRGFLEAFHDRSLSSFGHRDHLKLAWLIMNRHDAEEGLSVIRTAIREFAEYQGSGNRYHEILTTFWGRIVHHAIQTRPDVPDSDAFLNVFSSLLDKGLPLRHWTTETLWSEKSRASWTEPDLLPLP